jgi:hypothetical protein
MIARGRFCKDYAEAAFYFFSPTNRAEILTFWEKTGKI